MPNSYRLSFWLIGGATPSLAAEYFVVQDTATKRCSIVEQRPTSKTTVIVGPGTAYATRTEAEAGMKTVKVCESGGTVGGPVPPPPPGRYLARHQICRSPGVDRGFFSSVPDVP
jgi:hypothetical protein